MRKAVQRRRLTMQTVHRSDTVRSKWTFYKFLCYRNFTVCTFPSKLCQENGSNVCHTVYDE